MLPYIFFSLLSSCLSLAAPLVQDSEGLKTIILNKLEDGITLGPSIIKFIKDNVSKLEEEKLKEIKSLNGNALKIVFHPTNAA